MNLADIRKRHGLDEKKTEKKSTTQTTASHMLDEIRARHNLGKVTSTREKVEEAKAAPRLYKNEAEYYAANARPYDEVKAELDAVTKRRNTYDNEKAMRDSGISGKVWQKRYGEKNTERIEELAHLIEMENKRIDSLTKEAQYGRLKGYNDLANSEDFDAKSVYDKNAKATVANQLYRQVNNPELPLTNEEYSDATREITRQMTADEVKIFNYIYNTQGDKAAQEYFDYLKTDAPDPLNSRRGKEIAGNIDTDVGRAIYGGIAAVDNTTQGVKQLFTSEAVKPTVAQYASAQAAEDVETKVGKFAYDLSATVGNMAPSILASTLVGVVNPLLGKAVGSTLMGAASAGNTYTDAINSGMTPRQAMKYGAMVGASEAALESVLGGISSLGANPVSKAAGKLVSGSKFAKAIGAVDNAFVLASAKLAGSMAGEIAEEELQLFLEPLFKMMATDEKYDAPEWGEIAYTALISAASAGLFEAPGNIAEAVQESRQKKAEKILKDAIAEHEKQSEKVLDENTAQTANDDENAQQTANDTAEEKAAEIERKDAYSEMVANYADSMDAAGQNVFIEAYDGSVEPDVYVREMQDAYDAGRRGESLAASETVIGDDRRQLAYKAGIADKATADADYGFVHNEVSHTVDRALVQNLNRIGKDLKVKIQFVDSVRGDTANGSYRNGVITISRKAENPYMVVAKHEITHHLKQTAAKSYGAYEAYAVETFAKSLGLSADALVQERIAEAVRSGDRLTAEQAREEIAADFTEMIFTDEKTLRRFVETHSKSLDGRNMLQRLFDAIRRFIARLGKMDESVLPGMGITREQLEKAEKLYREVLAEGAQQRGAAVTTEKAEDGKTAVFDKSGEIVAETKDGKAMLSLKTYRENGRGYLVDWLDKRVQSKQLTEKEAADIVSQLDEYYKVCQKFVGKYAPFGAWSEAEVVKGLDGKPAFSVIKKNGEYAMNLDFSLVCKKRRALDAVFREMINRGTLDNANLGQTDIAKINDIIRANGLETACALCFVDSKRYRVAKVADDFVSKYNEAVKLLIPEGSNIEVQRFGFVRPAEPTKGRALHDMDNSELKEGIAKLRQVMANESGKTVLWKICKNLIENPYDRKYLSRSEFINSDGFEAVTTKNPRVLTLYNSSKGSGGPKASLPDVQYLGDILRDKKFDPKKAFAVGGVRIQSFSDYIPRLVFDYMQMIGDLAAKKLPAHAYTKEAMFALQFGMTGVKINLSLVPAVVEGGVAPGLDADGNYAWIDGQSFGSDVNVKGSAQKGFEQAVAIQNAEGYSANCGTIAVGISDEHIWKMLDDDRIRMVIPYHKSGLNHMVAVMNNIDKYEDYTDVQNTRRKQIDENGAEKWVKLTGKDFSFNEALRRTGDAKTATNEYLEWCEKNGFKPKFDKFAKHENYYKLLEDFSCYDNGKPAMQGEVKMVFPDETSAFGSMSQLIEQGLEEDAVLEGKKELAVPKIVDEIEKTVGSKAMMSLKKRDTDYLDAVKRGDTETAQRIVDEAAKAAGYVPVSRYHQTGAKFNEFMNDHPDAGLNDSDTPNGFFFKENDHDIGVGADFVKTGHGGSIQMRVYLKHNNMLYFKDRDEARVWYSNNVPGYRELLEKYDAHLSDFEKINSENNAKMFDELIALEESGQSTTEKDLAIMEKYDKITYEWIESRQEYETSLRAGMRDLLNKYFIENDSGYDGIELADDGHRYIDMKREDVHTFIVFKNTQIKSADPVTYDDDGNVIPLSERFNPKQSDIRYSTKGGGLDALRKQYGEIEPGENPVRQAHVPRKTEKHKNVSQTVRTIIEAGVTPDYIVPAIEELIEDGTVSFETVTDKHAYKVAKGKVKAGYTQAWNDWFKAVNQGRVSKELTATGWALYDYAVANKNDFSEALEILVAMAGHQRNAAQALQATRILKRMTPEGQLAAAQRAATKLEEEANKKYTDSTAGRKAKEQAAEADDAVTEARKGAAKKAANNFKKAAEDGEYESVPFVFEYAQKVGEAVASAITREAAEGQRTTMEIITNQLIKFAREKVPNAARKSKGDILVDLVNNYEFYAKAYKWAQNEVAREYGEDERFEEFLDTPIGTDADSYAGRIIGRSIADALVGVGETKKIIREKAALGFGEVFKTVGDYLVEKTGAKGRAENMLRNAAAAYVTDIILTNPKSDTETVNKLIREVIRDTGVKLSDTIRKGDDAMAELKTAVVSTLTAKYNLPAPYAKQAAGIIEKQFEQMAREEAAKELDRRFKEKKIVTPKTQREILTELARLGAFKMDSKYNAQAVERLFRTGYTDIKIDQVLAERLLTATSEKARDEALHDIYRDIGRQMPSTFLDKWNAWRYLAMLGNVRTHGRNIVGNAAFVPLVGAKNVVATGLEKAVYTFGGQRLQRTKGIPTKELLAAAYKDYSKLTDKELAGEKYNDRANANAWIEEGRQIFGQKTKFGKGVEALRKGNSELLSKEDEWFVKPHYALALAQYCKADGITAQMIAAGKGLDKARQYAIKEAQKATYRDANAVSEAVSKIGKYKGDNVALKAGSLFVDAVLPFRKTPANILVRAVEYSPVGLIKSVTADLVRMKQGKINGAQVIDNLAAGLTGTALMGLGVLLSKLGLVIGMGSDDEDERKFNELQGYQGYAIVFDDRTYTVDWLAPEAMPFFVGVNLAELKAFKEANVSEMLSALTNITAPMLEMSCLQGLNDMIEAAGSVQSKGVSAMMQMVSNAATSYLTQALPTLFGQVERVTESTRRQTYADKGNKVLTPNMQYTLGKAFNKLPGDVAQIPYIDAWGRETETGNVGVRAFNNLLNPGYSAKIRTSDMEKELQRLFDETGEKSVLPDRAAKYITVEGEKIDLNKNQYVKYATVKGQTAYDMLTKITASSQYKALGEQSKVDLISKVYSYANAIAKAEVTKTQKDKALRYQPDGWIKKAADTSKATGIPAWKYVLIYNGQTDIRGLTDKDGDTISLSSSLLMMEYLYGFIGLSDAQRQALYADFGVAKSVRHYDRQRVAQELKKMRAKAGK